MREALAHACEADYVGVVNDAIDHGGGDDYVSPSCAPFAFRKARSVLLGCSTRSRGLVLPHVIHQTVLLKAPQNMSWLAGTLLRPFGRSCSCGVIDHATTLCPVDTVFTPNEVHDANVERGQ